MMSKVFISYSRKDEDEAHEIADNLKTMNVDAWLDTERIRPGEDYIEAIRQAIADSDVFLALLSPNTSHSEWVELETTEVLKSRNRKPAMIIPVLVAGEPDKVIPTWLKDRQYVDARQNDNETLRQLASVLKLEPAKP